MQIKDDKIIFEPDDMDQIAKEAEQIQQFSAELKQAATGWVSTKKPTPAPKLPIAKPKAVCYNQTMEEKGFKKLTKKIQAFTKKHRKDNRRELDEIDLFVIDVEEMENATANLYQAIGNFSQALRRLNNANAKLNRGPVDIADELHHHCVLQETLNKDYADLNARYNAKSAENSDRTIVYDNMGLDFTI